MATQTKQITLRIPEKEYRRIVALMTTMQRDDELMAIKGVSQSTVARLALREGLTALESKYGKRK